MPTDESAPEDDAIAAAWVARCALGDAGALRSLHAAFARRLYRYAYTLLHDADDCDTVVVDTLHDAWRASARFRGDSRVSSWLFGIARYKALALLRARGRHAGHVGLDEAEALPAEGLAGADGESLALRSEEIEHVRDCLSHGAGLSDVQRECLLLVHVEDCSVAEVAAIQAVPPGTVKTRLFHARRLLRACVQRCAAGSGSREGVRT